MEKGKFLEENKVKELPSAETRPEEELKRTIRKMELKVTGPRLLILKVLHKMPRHITAQEVFEKIQPMDSTVGFATVYRFLKKLVEHKVLSETKMNNMPARYELVESGHHDHLVCLDCGKICEFYNSQIEELQAEIAKRLGFVLTNHLMELQGYCFECRSKGH